MAHELERFHPEVSEIKVHSTDARLGGAFVANVKDRMSSLITNKIPHRQSNPMAGDAVSHARAYFGGLADWQRDTLNTYVSGTVPQSLWPDDLGTDCASYYASAASPRQIMNLLEWNTEHVSEINCDPVRRSAIENHTKHYYDAVIAAVDAGHLPSQTTQALEKAIATPIEFGSVFDVEMTGIVGYTTPNSDRIVLSESADSYTVTHERGHVLGDLRLYPQINEAVVEHLTLGFEAGDLTTVAPQSRAVDSRVFVEKRRLLAAVMSSGLAQLDIRYVADPYIEQDPCGAAAGRLLAKTTDAYPGVDVWNFMTYKRNEHSQKVQQLFPEAPSPVLEEAVDLYATLAVKGLGVEVRQQPVAHFQEAVEGYAVRMKQYSDDCQNAEPPLPRRTVLNAQMQSFSATRFAGEYYAGT